MLIGLFRRFLAPYRGLIGLVLVTSLLGTMAALTLPALNAAIVDRGIAHGDIGFIWRTGAAMLGISLVQGICSIASAWFGAKAAMSFGRDLRAALFGHVLALSTRELGGFGTPSLITRNTGDVQQLQMLVVMSCTMLVTAPITMIGGIVMAAREDSHLFWIVALAMPVLAAAIGLVIARLRPLFATMQGRIDAVGRTLPEQLTGLRVVRAFVREPHEQARFAHANRELTDTATAVAVLMAWVAPIVMVVLNVFNIALLWAGAHRIAAGEMQIGSLIAFLSYMLQILTSVTIATFLLMMIPRSMVCAQRIGEVLATEPAIAPRADDVVLRPGPATVAFDGVDYAYPGAELPVLRDIGFSARAGETLAIIGSTGAGKTTLVSLLPRLLDVTGGAVRVDGIDVRRIAPASLHARIGFVPQKAFLFAGTIASNLRYGGGDASDDDLWHALRVAQAEDFVRAMPDRLEAPVAQSGSNLSGGQRQRLAIARALLGRPDIYVFDDAFSALDMATEARLRAALRAETGQALTIMVSQRVATIVDADRILVLEDGAIIGDGTHQSLLGDCATYGEIVDSQQQRSAA